jgi:hypothetical protein
MRPVLTLEFTIEPFVEGQPGPHVLLAVAAVETLGATVEFGPFGSTCTVPIDRAGEFAQAIIAAAFANGATHVSLTADRGIDSPQVPPSGVDEWADGTESR